MNCEQPSDSCARCPTHDEDDYGARLNVFERGPTSAFAAPRAVMGKDGKVLRVTSAARDDTSSDTACLRPAAADLDGDGRIDLVVGTWDGTFAFFRGAGHGVFVGVEEATAKKRLAAWEKKQDKHWRRAEGEQTGRKSQRMDAGYEALKAERAAIVHDEQTGFVWLLRQK